MSDTCLPSSHFLPPFFLHKMTFHDRDWRLLKCVSPNFLQIIVGRQLSFYQWAVWEDYLRVRGTWRKIFTLIHVGVERRNLLYFLPQLLPAWKVAMFGSAPFRPNTWISPLRKDTASTSRMEEWRARIRVI